MSSSQIGMSIRQSQRFRARTLGLANAHPSLRGVAITTTPPQTVRPEPGPRSGDGRVVFRLGTKVKRANLLRYRRVHWFSGQPQRKVPDVAFNRALRFGGMCEGIAGSFGDETRRPH